MSDLQQTAAVPRQRATMDPAAAPGVRPPVVALVASAGGVEALQQVLAPLPAAFPAAVLVCLHMSPHSRGSLPAVLDRGTELVVRNAQDQDSLTAGTVLVAPPGKHLLISSAATVCLIDSGEAPPARPSGDLMLVTLAMCCGPRVTAVVMTGIGNDGTAGIRTVSFCGGTVLAQDEASSQHFEMPRSAISTRLVDTVVPLDQIADALLGVVSGP